MTLCLGGHIISIVIIIIVLLLLVVVVVVLVVVVVVVVIRLGQPGMKNRQRRLHPCHWKMPRPGRENASI